MQCLARAGHLAGGQLEAIEAAAREEEDLITTHVAGGAQLPLELIAFAQQPALSIAASLTGPWKLSSDAVKMIRPRRRCTICRPRLWARKNGPERSVATTWSQSCAE